MLAAAVDRRLADLVVAIKGAGEMASAIACRLHRAQFRRILLLELPEPVAVRRRVAFSEAVYVGRHSVEDTTAIRVDHAGALEALWGQGYIGVLVDPTWQSLGAIGPDVVVDAILAKRNLGTTVVDAPLVVALGPGFAAGIDAHIVIGTNRGHNLGRVRTEGTDEPNTGIPAEVNGVGIERVLRAPRDGPLVTSVDIGARVRRGDIVGEVGGTPVVAATDGVVRGLLRSGAQVRAGLKLGDIDPRPQFAECDTISDKGRAIAGAVLEAILWRFNR